MVSYRTVASAIMASVAFVMELTLVPLILPVMQSHHGLAISDLAWFFNSYGISVALGVIVSGWIGDRFGIKRLFYVGLLMFASGAAIVAFASGFEPLIGARILQGFGGGLFSPLVPLLLTRALPQRPGKILMVWGSITGYVAAIAPWIISQFIAFAGWQSVFVLFFILAGLAFALSLERNTQQAAETARTSPPLLLLLHAHDLWLVFAYIFCTYGAITFYLFRLPLWMADINLSVELIGIMIATLWLSFSVVGTLLRNWVDGTHVQKIFVTAPFLIGASFLVAQYFSTTGWLAFSAVLLGAGFACSNAPSTQLVLKFAPEGLSIVSASLDITFARLGGFLTVALLAQLSFGYAVSGVVLLSLIAAIAGTLCMRNSSSS